MSVNGRTFPRDVDSSSATLTANSDARDCIVNDSAFLETFPYIAPPNP
jgi:hypothetical protein